MSSQSTIEWTDASWNPVRGCTKVSPGCKHCYAERFAERFRGVPGHPFEQGFDLKLAPLRWKKPRRIFVNSMSDLFHESVPFEYVDRVWAAMLLAPQHSFQVLTKRPARMRTYLHSFDLYGRVLRAANEFRSERPCLMSIGVSDPMKFPAKRIWLGVSVEDRKYGLPRIQYLRESPARIRFLSIEPLLEDLGEIDLDGISWVIVGGESGPGARPLDLDWVRDIREQCRRAGVACFVKQLGRVWARKHLADPKGGDMSRWPADLRVREMPGGAA
jgi:protein gp37